MVGFAAVEAMDAVKLFQPDEQGEFVLEGVAAQAPAVGHGRAHGGRMAIRSADQHRHPFGSRGPEFAGFPEPFARAERTPGLIEKESPAARALFE